MGPDIELDDDVLQMCAMDFAYASHEIFSEAARRPVDAFPSTNGIGPRVAEYLRAVDTARAALADAARSASETLGSLVADSAEIDAFLAQSFTAGYALERGSL